MVYELKEVDMIWNANLYDDKHAFVSKYGESVLELLDVKPGEHILDLGCGTGHLAQQIKDQGGVVAGIDASASMIAKAKELFPEIDFEVVDGTNFNYNGSFDAVFSNATLHWIKDADAVIANVYKSLKHGGRFVAEMGGKGNMANMIAATKSVMQKHGYDTVDRDNPWYFPSPAQYATKLEAAGFRATFTAHFDRPTLLQDGRQGVAKWLTMFGPSFFKEIPSAELPGILDEITERLESAYNNNGDWYADYVRLRFIAVKES